MTPSLIEVGSLNFWLLRAWRIAGLADTIEESSEIANLWPCKVTRLKADDEETQSVHESRTQIQLPDEVYERARKVCQSREISMAELARRGFEYMLSVYTCDPARLGDWQPPQPRRLGWMGLTDSQIKDQAQLTTNEAAASRSRS